MWKRQWNFGMPAIYNPIWDTKNGAILKLRLIERSNHAKRLAFNAPIICWSQQMIVVGKGAQREVSDYKLTRYACYLIAQNGDPSKRK